MAPNLLSSLDGAILMFVKAMDTVSPPLAPREAMKLVAVRPAYVTFTGFLTPSH